MPWLPAVSDFLGNFVLSIVFIYDALFVIVFIFVFFFFSFRIFLYFIIVIVDVMSWLYAIWGLVAETRRAIINQL